MCYTGICPYEFTSGHITGDCSILYSGILKYPKDAWCMQGKQQTEANDTIDQVLELFEPAPIEKPPK